jgi:multisubunit Na+/H+ antiporter MnhG subunit
LDAAAKSRTFRSGGARLRRRLRLAAALALVPALSAAFALASGPLGLLHRPPLFAAVYAAGTALFVAGLVCLVGGLDRRGSDGRLLGRSRLWLWLALLKTPADALALALVASGGWGEGR